MEVNPFDNKIKKKEGNPDQNNETISNIITKSQIKPDKPKRYKDFIETKNEFYKQKFDILESQIDEFQRKSNRAKYISKFREEDENTQENSTKPSDEPYIEKERIIINNKGNGCGVGCNPLSIFGRLKCCGCIFFLIIAIGIYIFLLINNRTIQDFTVGNIIPNIVGSIDTSQLPDPNYFTISDRLKSEINKIEQSPEKIESVTVYDSELNTFLEEQNFLFADYPTQQYVTFDENRMNIYIKRKDKNDSWTIFKLQSDKLGKPQLISVQYGKLELSGENARNFMNNLPLNIGNINFEKLDEKFSDLLFPDGNHRIDKIIFSKGKADLSIVRK